MLSLFEGIERSTWEGLP